MRKLTNFHERPAVDRVRKPHRTRADAAYPHPIDHASSKPLDVLVMVEGRPARLWLRTVVDGFSGCVLAVDITEL